jgi:hypothetical protein
MTKPLSHRITEFVVGFILFLPVTLFFFYILRYPLDAILGTNLAILSPFVAAAYFSYTYKG